MKSRKAKVLHNLDGRPLISHVHRIAQALEPRQIYFVVGHQAEKSPRPYAVNQVWRNPTLSRRQSNWAQAMP